MTSIGFAVGFSFGKRLLFEHQILFRIVRSTGCRCYHLLCSPVLMSLPTLQIENREQFSVFSVQAKTCKWPPKQWRPKHFNEFISKQNWGMFKLHLSFVCGPQKLIRKEKKFQRQIQTTPNFRLVKWH